jgi:protein phosphatase
MNGDREITAELTPAEPSGSDVTPGRVSLTFAAKTDLGRVRENNEDKFDFWEPEDAETLASRGRLYAVADGMGGHAAGQIASEMALKAFGASYYSTCSGGVEDALIRAVAQANALVHDTQAAVPSRRGMGCTLVAAAIVGADAFIVWAGDSRAYRITPEGFERLTEDHSWVGEQVRAGVITPEEAETHPYRNIITRCLGPEPGVTPEVRRLSVSEGDILLLCSDGLTGPVRDAEIAATVRGVAPSFACRDLIDLANERGGPDNITVAVIRIDAVDAEPPDTAGAASDSDPATISEPPKRSRWSPFRR